jgi:hypothetical protein
MGLSVSETPTPRAPALRAGRRVGVKGAGAQNQSCGLEPWRQHFSDFAQPKIREMLSNSRES